MGPAGAGKVCLLLNFLSTAKFFVQSTYCYKIQQYCEAIKRRVHIFNLDPAAENSQYKCSSGTDAPAFCRKSIASDIRNLISVQEVVDELKYGPNGGLIFAMEYLIEVCSPFFAYDVADLFYLLC